MACALSRKTHTRSNLKATGHPVPTGWPAISPNNESCLGCSLPRGLVAPKSIVGDVEVADDGHDECILNANLVR